MAVRFAGSGADQLQYSGTLPDPATAATFTAWLYISTDTNAFATYFRTRNAGASSSTNASMDADGQTFSYFTGAGQITGPTVLTTGAWHRVALTHTGTTAVIYAASGLSGATASSTGTLAGGATPTVIAVGGRANGDTGDPPNGRLAHLRMWSSVLTQAQIEAEWLSWWPVTTTNLYAAWPLTGVADLADASGNGRTLTIPGTSPSTEDGPPIPSRRVFTPPTPLCRASNR